MKQLLMFLVMLSIPSVLHAAPLFKTIVYHNDSGKEKAPVYRYLHVGMGEILLDVEIRSDLATRTAKVFLFGKHKKDLDKKQLEKLEGLIAAPNYYQDGIVKDPEHENYGDFIDRGGGEFFSFEKGLADPVGRSGTREALKAFFKALAD